LNPILSTLHQALHRLGIAVVPDERGTIELYFDGLRVVMTPAVNGLRLEHRLGYLAEDIDERFRQLLAMTQFASCQLFNSISNCESLAIEQDSMEILIFRLLKAEEIEVDFVLDALSKFVNSVELWHTEVHPTAAV